MWRSHASRRHVDEHGGVGDWLDVKMIRGEGLLAKDLTVGIVCIRAALILGRARVLLQKFHAGRLPSAVGRPVCVRRVRVVVGHVGGALRPRGGGLRPCGGGPRGWNLFFLFLRN